MQISYTKVSVFHWACPSLLQLEKNKENKSQDHIYECSEIWKIRNENKNEQENYNNIYVGNLTQKLKVARIFEQNLKLYNEMFNKWKKK